jgi:hypothetical protein
MNGWIQRADLSSTVSNATCFEEAFSAWQSIDKVGEDQLMLELQGRTEEWCQWGLSFTNEDGVRIHICRESPEEDTYSVLISRNYQENHLACMPAGFVEGALRAFFSGPSDGSDFHPIGRGCPAFLSSIGIP